MRRVRFALALVATATLAAAAQAPTPHTAEHHEFTIDNFQTESGVMLPKATRRLRHATAS